MKNVMLNKYLLAVLGVCAITSAFAIDIEIPVATSNDATGVQVNVNEPVDSKQATVKQASNDTASDAETAQDAAKSAYIDTIGTHDKLSNKSVQNSKGEAQYLQQVGIPEVPVSVLRRSATNSPTYTNQARINDQSVLVMEPGVNQIVPVAVDHLNRIVTPFGEPVITTMSNNATTEVNQNVVYVGTNDEDPVTAFITEKGDQSRALSLTLVPQKIPPRELFLRLSDGYTASAPFSNPQAKRWETSQPYVEAIRTAFRSIALGDLPQGYALGRMTGAIPRPNCDQAGLRFDFGNGQVLTGHSLSIMVGVARNTSTTPIEFKESACGNWDVAAVSAWPINVLEAGEATEIYIARKVNSEKPQTSKRPSLLGR